MSFLDRGRKKNTQLSSLAEQPDLIFGEKNVTGRVPGIDPVWPIMGAGEDYLSVNAFNCLDPEVFLQKYYLLRRFLWFLFIVLGFWGISLWHGTHDEQTLACIVLGACGAAGDLG